MCSCAKSHPWSDVNGNLILLQPDGGPGGFYDKPRCHLNRSKKPLPVLAPVLFRNGGGLDLGAGNFRVNHLEGFQIPMESSEDSFLFPILSRNRSSALSLSNLHQPLRFLLPPARSGSLRWLLRNPLGTRRETASQRFMALSLLVLLFHCQFILR